MNTVIFIRSEINKNEYRTPLVPEDIKFLINRGMIVYIEKSENRIYNDTEYLKVGAILTIKKWYDPMFQEALIIGLKELSNLNKLNYHKHIYFSHSFKNQYNSRHLLLSFINSNSLIYDFEYFIENGKRIISFGFYAGVAGCILALLQYISKRQNGGNLKNIYPFDKKNELKFIKNKIKNFKNLKIDIIGFRGNVGTGVRSVLDYLGIEYNLDNFYFENYDIVFNCIKLNETYNKTWISPENDVVSPLLICDISCDYNKENNPIKLYNDETTWKEPVYSFNNYIDIIAISNLPSLLPKESSDDFSSKLVKLLLNFGDQTWKNCLNYFNQSVI